MRYEVLHPIGMIYWQRERIKVKKNAVGMAYKMVTSPKNELISQLKIRDRFFIDRIKCSYH